MNIIEKSESIRAGLLKGVQDGTSKMVQRAGAMDTITLIYCRLGY